jgi:methionyl-tRNA formyltransferase
MKIVFFGTPNYVIPILDVLHKNIKLKSGRSSITAVVTQKPKLVGRKKIFEYSAVDKWSHKKGVRIIRDLEIKNLPNADVGVLASYGNIIPKNVINHFLHGILNVHPSLLPKYRGASPVPATIISGEKETGVSIIKLDNKLDHGLIVGQFKESVQVRDTTETLRDRLFEKSSNYLVDLLLAYIQGKIKLKEQDHKKAIFTREISKQDAFIPPKYLNACLQGRSLKAKWKIPFMKDYSLVPNAYSLERFIRAMKPWPVAWTYVQLNPKSKARNPKRLKILKAHIERKNEERRTKNEKSKLVLDEVQLEGKNPVSWKQFTEGYPAYNFKIRNTKS